MLQLSSLSEDDFRKPILAKQNRIRCSGGQSYCMFFSMIVALRQVLSTLKAIENDLYMEYKGHW